MAAFWERIKKHASRPAGLLGILTERSSLQEGLAANAVADIPFAIGSPETDRLLVVDRRWSADRFEHW
jgi:hypothetical protein